MPPATPEPRVRTTPRTAVIVANDHNVCGEGPLYDPGRKALFWADIDAGKLFQLDIAAGTHRQVYTGDPVGGFTLQEDGALLLFRVSDIVRFDPDTGKTRKLRDFSDPGIPRFNDTQAAPNGACFAGTMGKTKESGGLFLLSTNNTLTLLHRGTGCSNGIAWSPDRRTMYWQDSTRKTIFAYDFNAQTNVLSNERAFYTATDPDEGTPDGMATDSHGNVYSARWGGGGVYVYSPDARFLHKIAVDARQVSSCCFGGDDLRDLYITTAGRNDANPGAGALYHHRNEIPGLAQFRSKVSV